MPLARMDGWRMCTSRKPLDRVDMDDARNRPRGILFEYPRQIFSCFLRLLRRVPAPLCTAPLACPISSPCPVSRQPHKDERPFFSSPHVGQRGRRQSLSCLERRRSSAQPLLTRAVVADPQSSTASEFQHAGWNDATSFGSSRQTPNILNVILYVIHRTCGAAGPRAQSRLFLIMCAVLRTRTLKGMDCAEASDVDGGRVRATLVDTVNAVAVVCGSPPRAPWSPRSGRAFPRRGLFLPTRATWPPVKRSHRSLKYSARPAWPRPLF